MTTKTIKKLEEICKNHGVTMEARYDGYGEWDIFFNAPENKRWNVTQGSSVCYFGSLRGVVGFLRGEIEEGFYDEDEDDD